MTRLCGLALLALAALAAAAAETSKLEAVATRDPRIVRRFAVDGDPHGVAVAADGTIYVGLAQPQAVIAVDPKSGAIRKRLVLDSVDIASTKELVTIRTNSDATRLYIANGSDESASILEIPRLGVRREITIEGEPIRDALPDPSGRYLYLLGRRVHVYDIDGEKELRTLAGNDPMAIAATAKSLAVVIADPSRGGAPTVVEYDTATFSPGVPVPLPQSSAADRIDSALFTPDGLLVLFGGKSTYTVKGSRAQRSLACLASGAGPQIAAFAEDSIVVGEECTTEVPRPGISPLEGAAYALAPDTSSGTVVATDSAGYLTIYKSPRGASR